MAQIRAILGHVSVEIAGGKRMCHRNRKKHSIAKGEICLVIRELADRGQRNYCCICARQILDQAKEDLTLLDDQLFPGMTAVRGGTARQSP